MTPNPTIAAATRLADALDAENRALRALDLPAATALLTEKAAATEALAEARRAGATPGGPDAAAAAARLRSLAEENRRLLERAIAVQNRIIGTLARAARQGAAPSRYGAGGAPAATRQAAACAVVARA